MKHLLLSFFSLIIILSVPSFVLGQNLMQNGDLESWPSTTNPEGWDKAENIHQETTIFLNGANSARHESASSTKDFQQVVEGVVPGTTYSISYNYLDNDPSAKTRIWSYWLSGGSTLDDNADILRPTVYSDDNPDWQLWETELTAPSGADAFRFEVRVYNQDGNTGGSVYYDDFSFSSGGVLPEPTNYPTDFQAEVNGLTINLSWTDATGAQPPGAYLVLASDEDNIVAPTDGNFVSDDEDLSDGSAALNITQGNEEASFTNLMGLTTYYFEIYPYTNGGPSVDYKTDGTAPATNATTADIEIIEFIDFNTDFEDWSTISVTGSEVWENDNTFGLDNTPCAAMSGYSGGANENEDWLVSPPMNFDLFEGETLEFWTATNYDGPTLEIKVSNEYSGGDPNSAQWDDLAATLSTGSWEWTSSGQIDLSDYTGSVYVAFKYTSTTSGAATWEVDDVMVTGTGGVGINESVELLQAELFPNPADDHIIISTSEGHFSYKILSVDGKLIMEGEGRSGDRISLAGTEQGLYLVEITSPEGTKKTIKKFMVNR